MVKHLIPKNDIWNHRVSKDCPCLPILSQAVIRHEMVVFYSHNSWDMSDICEKVGIKTNEIWEIEYETEEKQ